MRESRYSRRTPIAFQNPFPEFWNSLGQCDKAFRHQRQAFRIWPANWHPDYGARRRLSWKPLVEFHRTQVYGHAALAHTAEAELDGFTGPLVTNGTALEQVKEEPHFG